MGQKAYVKLADPGTTFYDQVSQTSLAGDKVFLVELTPRMAIAFKEGQVTKLDKEEGEKLYKAQLAAEAKEQKSQEAPVLEPSGAGNDTTGEPAKKNELAADDEPEDDEANQTTAAKKPIKKN